MTHLPRAAYFELDSPRYVNVKGEGVEKMQRGRPALINELDLCDKPDGDDKTN